MKDDKHYIENIKAEFTIHKYRKYKSQKTCSFTKYAYLLNSLQAKIKLTCFFSKKIKSYVANGILLYEFGNKHTSYCI